jgi:ubiquinone/menaquinone biosynthesis C-methylase UbiE
MDAEAWNAKYEAHPGLWREEPNEFVVQEVGGLEPGTALDVGAGEGRNAVWLAARGWEVTAVDFSDVAVERGRRVAEERGVSIHWVVHDALAYDPGQDFDLILIAYLQVPHREMQEVLATATRHVTSGGTLLVIAHAKANLEGGYGGPPDAAVLYEPDELASWIPDLSVDRAEHVVRIVETDEGPREAIDLVVRARR